MNEETKKYFLDWATGIIGEPIQIEKEPHGDEGEVYKLHTEKGNYFLKMKANSTSTDECEKLKWLQGKIAVPTVAGFIIRDEAKALLLTALPGKNLKVLCKEWLIEKTIEKVVEALHVFHAVDSTDWPFEKEDPGTVFVHGDACLPNFIFEGDRLSGFIDVGEARLATPDVDLGAVIWILQYNLGPGYGVKFLEKYGYSNATEEVAENLRLQYEKYQQEHGFCD